MTLACSKARPDPLAVLFAHGARGALSDAELLARSATDGGPHRARERLPASLLRRGLAPAAGALVGMLEPSSRAAPADLVQRTVSAGKGLAGAVPAAVAELVGFTLGRIIMRKSLMLAGLFALGLATTGGAVALATGGGDEPKATARSAASKPALDVPSNAGIGGPEPVLAEKFDRLEAEYEAATRAFQAFFRGSTIPEEDKDKAAKAQPDFSAVVRRIAELAATAPNDPAVRDAMLWVLVQHGGISNEGPHAGALSMAASWLVRHFGDDPDAVRIGLELDNWPTFCRDDLLLCFYASAKGRESKGLARLALAQYLERKAELAAGARKIEGRPTYTHDDLVRADGSLYTEKEIMPDSHYAYLLHLKQCDVQYLRAEADRLYEEVIADFGDVPCITARDRMLEALLKKPEPQWRGRPLTDEDRRKVETGLARRRTTLGQVALARLDLWHNLAVGKTAPEIEGLDVHGKPLKLANYRGKVVVLVFWATSCGPCMREIPREKALVERMKGRPFAMLGVNSDNDIETARKALDAHGVTWPSFFDGVPADGPIAKRYRQRGYPTYVIDAEGKIRSKSSRGGSLDELVAKLVAEREAAAH